VAPQAASAPRFPRSHERGHIEAIMRLEQSRRSGRGDLASTANTPALTLPRVKQRGRGLDTQMSNDSEGTGDANNFN
jgi:hypothetical protein